MNQQEQQRDGTDLTTTSFSIRLFSVSRVKMMITFSSVRTGSFPASRTEHCCRFSVARLRGVDSGSVC